MYENAQRCFEENVKLVSPPGNDQDRLLAWNLNAGLTRLVEALAQDIGHLESQIAALRSEVQQLRTQR